MRHRVGRSWIDDGPAVQYRAGQGLGAVPLSAAQPMVRKAWPELHAQVRYSRTAEAQRAYRARRRAAA